MSTTDAKTARKIRNAAKVASDVATYGATFAPYAASLEVRAFVNDARAIGYTRACHLVAALANPKAVAPVATVTNGIRLPVAPAAVAPVAIAPAAKVAPAKRGKRSAKEIYDERMRNIAKANAVRAANAAARKANASAPAVPAAVLAAAETSALVYAPAMGTTCKVCGAMSNGAHYHQLIR